jgi:hypothetical protein
MKITNSNHGKSSQGFSRNISAVPETFCCPQLPYGGLREASNMSSFQIRNIIPSKIDGLRMGFPVHGR